MPETNETVTGINQTKEALTALGALAVVARKAWREAGGDAGKFATALGVAIMQSPETLAAVKVGFDGVKEIPAEVKDLNMLEGIELAEHALTIVRKSFIEVA